MITITVSEAFGNAPPRSAAVLCVKGNDGRTNLMLADWFTWLNIKRNPMISFSLPRGAEIGKSLREGDAFVLAFPPLKEAKRYQAGVSAGAEETGENAGREPVSLHGLGLARDDKVNKVFVFPDIALEPGGFALVYCDGAASATLAGELHAPFGMASASRRTDSGERRRLARSVRAAADSARICNISCIALTGSMPLQRLRAFRVPRRCRSALPRVSRPPQSTAPCLRCKAPRLHS